METKAGRLQITLIQCRLKASVEKSTTGVICNDASLTTLIIENANICEKREGNKRKRHKTPVRIVIYKAIKIMHV